MPHPPAVTDADGQLLALSLADVEAAAAQAEHLLQQPDVPPERRVRALAVQALCALRQDEDTARALDLLTAAEAQRRTDDMRSADLLQHTRAQWLRAEGRLEAADTLLTTLQPRSTSRPVVDAYLSAASLGIVRSMRADHDGSLDLFYQALALARRSGEDSLIVNALNNLGSTQSDLFNLDDAEPLLRECLQRACRLASRRLTIFAAGNLAQCLCFMGRAPEALQVVRAHLIPNIRPDDPPSLQRDEEIAQALLDNGLIDEAAERLARQPCVDPMSNELATARVWLEARLQRLRGRPAEALRLCTARLALLAAETEPSCNPIDEINLLRVSADAAHQVGDHALAYQLLGRAFSRHEALLGRAARSRQLSLQITHRLQQTEWERDAAQAMADRMAALNASLKAQIDETERLQQRLRAQALQDPLTGLSNRRHLMDAGPARLAATRQRGQPLAVALIDLDHFKRINDTHGHDAGDRVLCAFAGLARAALGGEDMACRFGGEEFVLLMPGLTAAQAEDRLNRLLLQFKALRLAGGAVADFSCSFSAGVAMDDRPDDSLSTLIARADEALYAAKVQGRSRVRMAKKNPANAGQSGGVSGSGPDRVRTV